METVPYLLVRELYVLISLFCGLMGAGMAARAVILTKEQAVNIGVSRVASGNFDEDLKSDAVQSLLKQSATAKWVLRFMAVSAGFHLSLVLFDMFRHIVDKS